LSREDLQNATLMDLTTPRFDVLEEVGVVKAEAFATEAGPSP
jgi:hypothetical protein